MSVDSQLEKAFGVLLAKARQRELQRQETLAVADAVALIINFDGAGQPLTVGMGGIPEMPSGSFTIVGCHMAAGIWSPQLLQITAVPVSASVDLGLVSRGSWGGGTISLTGGIRPTLTNQAEADIDITGWITQLQPQDLIPYALSTFTGIATVLTLTITLRRVDVPGIGTDAVTDETGGGLTDESGIPIVTRF